MRVILGFRNFRAFQNVLERGNEETGVGTTQRGVSTKRSMQLED